MPSYCFYNDPNNCLSCCNEKAKFWDGYVNAQVDCRGSPVKQEDRESRIKERESFKIKCAGHCGIARQPDPGYQDPRYTDCDRYGIDYQVCFDAVLKTPRNEGANHRCFNTCGAMWGAPFCNQVELKPASLGDGELLGILEYCRAHPTSAECKALLPDSKPGSTHYVNCFYDCLQQQAKVICKKQNDLFEQCRKSKSYTNGSGDSVIAGVHPR